MYFDRLQKKRKLMTMEGGGFIFMKDLLLKFVLIIFEFIYLGSCPRRYFSKYITNWSFLYSYRWSGVLWVSIECFVSAVKCQITYFFCTSLPQLPFPKVKEIGRNQKVRKSNFLHIFIFGILSFVKPY